MEIPDQLKDLKVDDEPKIAFISALINQASCGVIIKRIAFLDNVLLKDILIAYAAKAGEAATFAVGQITDMSFSRKIKVFAGIAIAGDAALMRDSVVMRLEPMRKIRNIAAHEASLTSKQTEELWADSDCRTLLADFPSNFEGESNAIQKMLQELQLCPEFAEE